MNRGKLLQFRLRAMVPLAAFALAAIAVACGGEGEATATSVPPTSTSGPAQQPSPTTQAAPSSTPVPTATRQAAPTVLPTATQRPSTAGPTDKLTVALPSIGAPIFVNSQSPYPRNLYRLEWGICEPLASVDRVDPTQIVGVVAESWSISESGDEMTFNIHEGVKFHGDNGEVTAEDVAWSYNEAGVDNPDSLTGGGAALLTTWEPWEATGPLTVKAKFDRPESNPLTWGYVNGSSGSGHCILSKSLYDEVGAEAAVTTMVATGPFEAKEWTTGNRLVANAVNNHWRITPGFAELVILEVPEEATRDAMIKSGQADVAQLALKTVKETIGGNLVVNDTLRSFNTAAVFMGGNYWYDPAEHKFGEEPVQAREGFQPDDAHPWIGDPGDPVRHERARKVREGMAMAIDRAAINETILGGLGDVAYIPGIPLESEDWEDEWVVPYDPAAARDLIEDAGYPDGFQFDYWIPSDFPNVDVELAQAVAEMWRNIGLEPNIQLLAYTAGRPNLMEKKQSWPWMWFMAGDGVDYDNGHLRSARYQGHAGWNGGVEIPELGEFYQRWLLAQGDRAAQVAIFKERSDWLRQWMPFASVADMPVLFVTNNTRIQDWVMYPKIEPGAPNSFEVAQPVR